MLTDHASDSIEARALSFNRDLVDIYSSSWGPTDDGIQLSSPGQLVQQALTDGVNYVKKLNESAHI